MHDRYMAFEKEFLFEDDHMVPAVAEPSDLAYEIDQKNHWFEPGEIESEQMQLLFSIAARGLHELFRFCFVGRKLDRPSEMRMVMRRFLAVSWLIQPELLKDCKGDRMTLEDLASLPAIKCSKYALSMKATAFGKRWNFHTRIQKRLASKENYAAGARAGWAKRRALPPKEEQAALAL